MSSNYNKITLQIESEKCRGCGGLGIYDDAEPGDISCNTWTCPKCFGTGFKDGKIFAFILNAKLIKRKESPEPTPNQVA